MVKEKSPGLTAGDKQDNIPVFQLYITGASPNSSRAISNLKVLFEKYIKGGYQLQVIDVYQQPHIAESVDIIALPLLIRKLPLPERRLIGDMSNEEKIVKSFGLNAGK
jgi:circadian clock protein KaiB